MPDHLRAATSRPHGDDKRAIRVCGSAVASHGTNAGATGGDTAGLLAVTPAMGGSRGHTPYFLSKIELRPGAEPTMALWRKRLFIDWRSTHDPQTKIAARVVM
jgi:hypothetical protein